MGLFEREKGGELPKFRDRAEAFAYMLNARVAAGDDALVAAKAADEFATIFAENTGLPEKQAPTPQGIDKYICAFEKCCKCVDEHPKIIEVAVPILTFVAGIFAKKELTPAPPVAPPPPPVDATKLE